MHNLKLEEKIASTNYRWVILFLFANYSGSNAYQWIQYAIIPSEIQNLYNISPTQVDLLSVIFMVVYIPLIIPVTWAIDRFGLSKCCIIASFGNAFGAILKYLAAGIYPQFWLAFLGQTVAAISQLMVLTVPPILAGIWFPAGEVSTACSLGVMANQLGTAIGFLIPPLLSERLELLFGLGAAVCTGQAILMLIFFKKEPKWAPSVGQLERRVKPKDQELTNFKSSFKAHTSSVFRMVKTKNVCFLIISYGLNTGTYYAVSTLLGKFVLAFDFAAGHEGNIGLGLILAGLVSPVHYRLPAGRPSN